jgi:hypothetical protein
MGPKQAADQACIRNLQLVDEARRDLPSQPLNPKIQAQLDKENEVCKRKNAVGREKENREKINEKRTASKKNNQSDITKTIGNNLKKGQDYITTIISSYENAIKSAHSRLVDER